MLATNVEQSSRRRETSEGTNFLNTNRCGEQEVKYHVHPNPAQVRWECDLCKSTFTDQGNLRRHKLTKHEGATYDCYQCPAQFGNHGTLRRHILTEHEGVR